MAPHPVMVKTDCPLPVLARKMVETQVLRIIVVVKEDRPVGLVSSVDILEEVAAAAALEARQEAECEIAV